MYVTHVLLRSQTNYSNYNLFQNKTKRRINQLSFDKQLTSGTECGEYGSPILSSSGLLLVYSSSDHAPSLLAGVGDSGDLISIPTGKVDVVLLFSKC